MHVPTYPYKCVRHHPCVHGNTFAVLPFELNKKSLLNDFTIMCRVWYPPKGCGADSGSARGGGHYTT